MPEKQKKWLVTRKSSSVNIVTITDDLPQNEFESPNCGFAQLLFEIFLLS